MKNSRGHVDLRLSELKVQTTGFDRYLSQRKHFPEAKNRGKVMGGHCLITTIVCQLFPFNTICVMVNSNKVHCSIKHITIFTMLAIERGDVT